MSNRVAKRADEFHKTVLSEVRSLVPLSVRPAYDTLLGVIRGRGSHHQQSGHVIRARPWLLASNVLSWLDFARTSIKSRVGLALQYTGLALTLVTVPSALFIDPVVFLATASAVLVSLGGIYIEYRHTWRHRASIWIVDADAVDHQVSPFAQMVDRRDLVVVGGDFVQFPAEVSNSMMLSSLGERPQPVVAWQPASKRLALPIEQHKTSILLHKYRHAHIRPFNGQIVSQLTSLEKSLADAGAPMRFAPGRYFDMLASNYMATARILDENRQELFSVPQLMTENGRTLRKFESSRLADGVGVSTIAFDRDKRLLLIGQSEEALSSAGLLAPSGSGSLEPQDFPRHLVRNNNGAVTTLNDVITAGMNRELLEEAHLTESDIAWSVTTGYFRWLTRGAKPEYVGVTILNKRTDDLVMQQRLTERKWVKAIYKDIAVDFDALVERPSEPACCLSRHYRDQLSVPLAMALQVLGRHLADTRFRSMFFSQFSA